MKLLNNKPLSLFAASLLITGIASAQIKKGDVILGGNLSFNTQKIDQPGNNNKQSAITVSPSIGWAVKDNLTMGFNLQFYHYKLDRTGYSPQTQDSYGLGYFIRRYKMLGSGFAVFAEGNVGGGYAHSKNISTNYGYESTGKGYFANLGFYPGIAYFISRHAMLETGFQNLAYANYTHNRITYPSGGPDDYGNSSFNIGTGLSNGLGNFTVGFKWLM